MLWNVWAVLADVVLKWEELPKFTFSITSHRKLWVLIGQSLRLTLQFGFIKEAVGCVQIGNNIKDEHRHQQHRGGGWVRCVMSVSRDETKQTQTGFSWLFWDTCWSKWPWSLKEIYSSLLNLCCRYIVTAGPSETLRRNVTCIAYHDDTGINSIYRVCLFRRLRRRLYIIGVKLWSAGQSWPAA